MRSFFLLATLCFITGCSHHRQIDFVVRSADSGAPVAGAKLTGHPEPGGITLLDFIRSQWTYQGTPEAFTDEIGRARLRLPMHTPKGVESLDLQGNRIRKSEWASTRVLIEKPGFDNEWISHSLTEWKKVAEPVVVALDPE